jgi:hypothetical protein
MVDADCLAMAECQGGQDGLPAEPVRSPGLAIHDDVDRAKKPHLHKPGSMKVKN